MKRLIARRLTFALLLTTLLIVVTACKGKPDAEPTTEPTPTAEVVIMDELPVHSDSWADILNEEVEPPTPTPSVISTTTGRERSASLAYQPSFVCFDNDPDNRPLSGILEADIVYEAPAISEGSATRLMALFSDMYPSQAGPIGMAYSEFLELRLEWGGMLVHDGYPSSSGYPSLPADNAGNLLTNTGEAKQFFFTSEQEKGMFVDLVQLVSKQYPQKTAEEEVRFLLAEGYTYEQAASVKTIRLPFGGAAAEAVEFVFDPKAGMYLRYQTEAGGRMSGVNALAWNEESGALESVPLYVNNLIVQHLEAGSDGMSLVGEGACDFFVNGQHLSGTWSKEAANKPTYYYLENGNIVTLETGRTWIALHPADIPIEVFK